MSLGRYSSLADSGQRVCLFVCGLDEWNPVRVPANTEHPHSPMACVQESLHWRGQLRAVSPVKRVCPRTGTQNSCVEIIRLQNGSLQAWHNIALRSLSGMLALRSINTSSVCRHTEDLYIALTDFNCQLTDAKPLQRWEAILCLVGCNTLSSGMCLSLRSIILHLSSG
jgi:hypothetical protein